MAVNIEKCLALLESRKEVSIQEVEKILNDELIAINNKKKGTKTSKINALARIINKKDVRPIFQGYNEEDGCKIFTDSYRLAIVSSDIDIPQNKAVHYDKTKGQFPKYRQCLIESPQYKELENKTQKLKSEIKKVKEKMKSGELKKENVVLKFTCHNNKDAYFNAQYILDGLEVIEGEGKIMYTCDGGLTSFQLTNDKEEIYLALPLRLKENAIYHIDWNNL